MKKILVVEDDPSNLQILEDFLGAHGYVTCAATTGPEGIARFHDERPDLMLVDVQLPRKNGFEVCFEVKRSPHGSALPVLLMSAVYTDREHATRHAEEGVRADDYLLKPFNLTDLLARVRGLIGAA